MTLRVFGIILFLALGILSVPLVSAAQQAANVPRLGYISPGDIPRYDNAFLQGLQDQGYIVPGEIPRYDEAFWRSLIRRGYAQPEPWAAGRGSLNAGVRCVRVVGIFLEEPDPHMHYASLFGKVAAQRQAK